MRIPGEGTEQLINRRQEYEVYQIIKDLKISDTIRYFDPESGCKLTEYLENARCCDGENSEDVKKCMKVLRDFHKKILQRDIPLIFLSGWSSMKGCGTVSRPATGII